MISIIQAAGWPIWLLITCSVLALALVVERLYSLRSSRIWSATLVDEAIQASNHQVPGTEIVTELAQYNLLGKVLAAGWEALGNNPQCTVAEMRAAIESAGRAATHELNRYLPALATIVSAAPLLGLFGTVIGMIEIFGSQATTGSLAGGNPGELAHGISVALYNTAFGLIIAIPTLFFWQYFRARVNGYVLDIETAAERFARHLEKLCPANKGKHAR
ncbi:MAG: MotA/TolQ/ExbB proton channel family protein [Burkholderiaceae bacterium]|nr:MAG: MotA/TolQ/ExbB proton channel family protein [Burkholderiaceae bacterium]